MKITASSALTGSITRYDGGLAALLLMSFLASALSCGDDGESHAADVGVEVAEDAPVDVTDVAAESGTDQDSAADATDDGLHPLCERVEGLCDPLPDGERIGAPVVVAPSDSLPPRFRSQTAHNNLDVVWHDDRLFAAIRTGPNHFASPDTVMYVVSTRDLSGWRYEGKVELGTDVREPQLVSWDGRLWLYYAILGDNPFEFEPQGSARIEYFGPDDWSEPEPVFDDGLIPWRIKPIGDRLHMIGYVGGENVYDNDAELLLTHWLVSEDGEIWEAFLPTGAAIRESGASETDFVFRDDGSITAVQRNETGDENGFGSYVCRAPAGDLGEWECEADPRKYDSPLMLIHDDQPWLIARRNMTETGNYDLGLDDLPFSDRFLRYQLDYWSKPKRCSLWRVDGTGLSVEFEADLPSRGDTCFPEAIELGEGRFLVFNYTSPLDGEDVAWQVGQGGETWVYWVVVQL